ncbi:hypothetical protein V5O48_002020 [Marasmius crinis-equi]|uniref:Heterokaryon incompatibility domain-containing protein n=1 Tax=Marasmius crinis-equi TaxID=585013 RepID=A0ABR3FXF6_9AGAR
MKELTASPVRHLVQPKAPEILPTERVKSWLTASANVSVDPDLLSALSSGDGSPDSPTLAQDILGALLSQDSAPTGVVTNSGNEDNSQIQSVASPPLAQSFPPPQEEDTKSRGTALVALGIKIVDPSRYTGRDLRIHLHVDNKEVMRPIQFEEGYRSNQFKINFRSPIQIPLYVSSTATMNVVIDGIPQGITSITSEAAQWGVAQMLQEMPLRSQGVLFDLAFLVQFPGSSWQGDSPLAFLAKKFTLLTTAMATLDDQPHISPLWVSAGALVHATCSNAQGHEAEVANHPLVQPLISLFDAATALFAHGETVWTPDLTRSLCEHITNTVCVIGEALARREFASQESCAQYAQALDATLLCMERLLKQYEAPSSAQQIPSAPEMVQVYDEPLDYLRGATFDIVTSGTPQRIRFVDCRRLLEDGRLRVVELEDYSVISQVPYSVVSYVWRSNYRHENPEVLPTGLSGTFVVKDVEFDGDPISIDILLCAAKVSLDCGLPFTWIDRLCIIQKEVTKRDKPWQLERMHSLYQGSGRSIVFPDGLFTMALPEQHTPWLERIWTLEEGLLPENTQVLFAWKRGPGILVAIDGEDPQFSGAVVGCIEQVNDETGMINLLSLLQFSGPVAFVDEVARRFTDVRFDFFQGSGLHTFSNAFSLFRIRESEDADDPHDDNSVASLHCSSREVSLWHSAFIRDATFEDDIILILARFLGFKKQEGGEREKGLRRYKMNVRQKQTFGKALELSLELSISPGTMLPRRSHYSNWNMRRLMYDLFYTFDISPFYNYLIPPPYNRPYTTPPPVDRTARPPTTNDATLYLSSLTKPPAELSAEILGHLLAISPYSVKSIMIRGDSNNSPDNNSSSLSTGTLARILEMLPNLHCLSLRALTISADDAARVSPRTIPQVEFDNLHALTSPLRDFTALLSLLDIGDLWIRGPLSPPHRPPDPLMRNREAPSPSSLPVANALTTRPEPEFPAVVPPIHAVRSLYMTCSAAESLSWLSSLIDIGQQSASAERDSKSECGDQDFGSLRKVDVVCEDVRAAYILGDFLRSAAGLSVDHLVLDLGQLCRYQTPFQPQDPVRALMYHYPYHLRLLTLRTQWPIANPAALDDINGDNVNWDQVIMFSGNTHYIRTILAVIDSSPTEIDSCDLEVDIGDDASHTLESLLGGLATFHVADTLRDFLNYGWPRFSKRINFVWRRPAKAHENCTVDAEQLITGVLRALQTHQQQTVRLRDVEVSELTDWCDSLLRQGIITSRWELY